MFGRQQAGWHGQVRPDDLKAAAVVLAFAGAALLVGLVVAAGNPIVIALALGLIAGIALLNALTLVVWIVLVGVLVVNGPVAMFVPALDRVGWLFSLLGFMLTGAAMLYAAVGRDRFPNRAPSFVAMAALLFLFGVLSLLYSAGPLSEGVRALKRYFQFFGVLFILATIPFPFDTVRRWWVFLGVLAVLQLPFALFQRIVLVPMREGIPRVYPTDIVVGTMEGSLLGGGSFGVMSMLLFFALAFLLAAHRDRLISGRKLVLLGLLVSLPLALGTATVVIVLAPIALGAVYLDLIRRRPMRFLLGLALSIPVLFGLAWAYLSWQADAIGVPLDVRIATLLAYNFGDTPYFDSGLNRTSVYAYWWRHQDPGNPLAFLFGHGLGSSFGGINESDPGHMDQAHARMYIGLTAASSVLWDLGVVGLSLFLGMMISAARRALRLADLARPGFDRAASRALAGMALMMLVMFFHSNAPISVPSHEVLFALTLGLIAWRWRSSGTGNASHGAAAIG